MFHWWKCIRKYILRHVGQFVTGPMSSYWHHNDATMSGMASQITSLTIVYSTVYLGADQRRHQSSASLAFVRGIHRRPVNSPNKWPVTRKMFPLMTSSWTVSECPPGMIPISVYCYGVLKDTGHLQRNKASCSDVSGSSLSSLLDPEIRHTIAIIMTMELWVASWIRHYSDVIMSAMASQITGVSIVYSSVYSGADQRKH